jgi:hypothetical protein
LRDGINAGLTFGQARSKADDTVGYALQDLGFAVPGIPNVAFVVEAAENRLC